jgi:hypothetical protein
MLFANWSFVTRAFVYTWHPSSGTAGDLMGNFGLRNADGSAKPAWTTIRQMIAQGSCGTDTTTGAGGIGIPGTGAAATTTSGTGTPTTSTSGKLGSTHQVTAPARPRTRADRNGHNRRDGAAMRHSRRARAGSANRLRRERTAYTKGWLLGWMPDGA